MSSETSAKGEKVPDFPRFEDAIEQARNSSGSSKIRVGLGNGFSRACRNDLFAYDALFDRARDRLSPSAKQAFEALGTTPTSRQSCGR